ncbi:MAG: hypothetical protein L0H63_05635 [Nitrococcus sp.]|nr:hypothetical protein [Nitrococcus sp.]
MRSDYRAFVVAKEYADVPSGFDCERLNGRLFEFQRAIVRWALRRGRAAIFADTGLGKTAMQCEWADRVCEHSNGRVLILAPLCVARQTVREAGKFGIQVRYCRAQEDVGPGITVTNYEMLERFELDSFAGLVLDEAGIIKNRDGATRNALIESCRRIPYRLSCTATPSPNDHMELGNQCEFLGVMSMAEMLAQYFTHDGGQTSKWRLKGHGKGKFWMWLATWAVYIRRPSDIGFADAGYDLHPYQTHEHTVESPVPHGELFAGVATTLTQRREAKRATLVQRVAKVAEIVNASSEQWLVWCHLNAEQEALAAAIADAVSVAGSDDISAKESAVLAFIDGTARVLISKPSIFGHGLNLQNCRNMIFVGLDDSFEQQYQAIRRCWRYGQTQEVNVHFVTADSLGAIKQNIARKEAQMVEMQKAMVEHMGSAMRREIRGGHVEKIEYERDVTKGQAWDLHLGDCVDVLGEQKEAHVDYTLFSPPFASLYTYSASDYDMGNCRRDEEFYGQFRFLVDELLRVTKPGRLLSFHCMNLPIRKASHGFIGIADFRGELIRMFVDAGWIYHSEVCIWKDPVTAMQRTKALGLLHKQLKKDSAMSRQGIADYLVTMRKPGANPEPITHTSESFPVHRWQRTASPVWMDINATRTLQYRAARDNDDERHICPLQLDVIERALELWTNPNDLVLSPFAGIGSEGYCAVTMRRRFLGVELKRSYYALACRNLAQAEQSGTQGDLLADACT